MTTGPVNWASYDGGTLEKVLAVLIGQDCPNVKRRTPSSGDGGVDLLLQEDDGWHVRQVKGFTGRLSSGQKRKIKNSLEQLIADPRLESPIVRWTLSLPIDFTSGEEAWFRDLVRDAPFACDWEGEPFWNGLAARHPHVIDYYFRDGRDRVTERSRLLLSVVQDAARPISAMDVAGHLEQLRSSLNKDDPHYSYEFVSSQAAINDLTPQEGVVFSRTHGLQDGAYLTIRVVEKYRGASNDAPISGQLTLRIVDPDQGIDIRDAFEDFRLFGTPLELPNGSLDMVLSAPGGLGGSFEAGGGRIQAIPLSRAQEKTRLQVVDPEDVRVVELVLDTVAVTRGELGGVEFNMQDSSRCLEIQFRMHPGGPDQDARLFFHLNLADPAGRPVRDVMEALSLVSSLHPPHEMRWVAYYGSHEFASHPFDRDVSLVSKEIMEFLTNLETVQDHVVEIVTLPEEIDGQTMAEVSDVARLLRDGQLEDTWTQADIPLRDDVDPTEFIERVGGGGFLALEQDWFLEIEDQRYALGPVHQIVNYRLAADQPGDGRIVRIIPGKDDRLIQTLGPLPNKR